jgi:hypothetical protein
MIAVARYLLAEHVRSRSFVAPLAVLVGGVIVLYAQPPNPVLSTGGTVAAFLFPIGCWLALALLRSQPESDRRLLCATAGAGRFVRGRLLAAGLLALAASLFALAVPLAGGAFDRTPHLAEVGLILLANLVATLGATALAMLFSPPLVRSQAIGVLGLATVVVVAVPLRLPPFIPTARALDTARAGAVPARIAGDALEIVLFAIAATALAAWQWRRRE